MTKKLFDPFFRGHIPSTEPLPLLQAPQLNFRGAKSTKSCRICADGENDLGAVDRELALLEQSNAALFKALAQTRAVPSYPLPPDLDGETFAGS